MKTILFQGDSITDAGRERNNPQGLGGGYPIFVAARLGLDNPDEYSFINRGISGNRIVDVYARIKQDIINLKPDCMSLLIGVNDVWHEVSCQNGVAEEKFEKIYTMLLEEIFEALPEIKIMLIEPFVLEGSATAENIEIFRAEVAKRAEAVRRIGEKFSLPVISLQEDLEGLTKKAPNDYWLYDGVHPTVFFHQYIADRWIEEFKKMNN